MTCAQNPSQMVLKCYLILAVISIYGKINVIAENELTEDCSESDSEGPIVSIGNERLQPNNNTFQVNSDIGFWVKCRSKSPVKLRYSGFLPNPPKATWTKITPINGTRNLCHEVIVEVYSNIAATGNYRCENQRTGLHKSAFIFVNTNQPPYLVYAAGKVAEVPGRLEDDQIVLPCISTNSSIEVKLFKGNDTLSSIEGVHYDPSKGFWFNKFLFDNPNGIYKCVVMTTTINQKLIVRLNIPTFTPQSTTGISNIRFEVNNNEEIQCKNAQSMTIVRCNTPMDCDFVRSCGQRFLRSSNICNDIVEKRDGNIDEEYVFAQTINITSISPNEILGGLVYCSKEDSNTIEEFNFFTDLKRRTILNFQKNPRSFENNTYMVSTPLKMLWENDFFTEEYIPLLCNVSKLVFADTIEWEFKLKNGSVIQPEIFNETLSNENNYYSKISILKISDTNISEILCKARSLNLAEWHNVSHSVTVQQSIPVEIINGQNETLHFELTDPNPELSCTASGLPIPSFTWFKNGEEEIVSSNITHENDGYTHILTANIPLRLISSEKSVVYICNATNLRNTVLKYITVVTKIPENRGGGGGFWILIAAILTLVMVFTLAAGAIIYLRFKKSIQTFSKEDQNAFFKGGEEGHTNEACLSNDEPNYLNLPYSKETEIPDADKNLIIEGELGRGNFGIVSKGRLNIKGTEKFVAVKSIKPGAPLETFKDFLSELKILQYVGEHENVIRLIGSVTKDIARRNVLIVVEYCEFNDLREFLINHKNSFQNELQETPIISSHYCSPPTCQAATTYSKVEYTIRTINLIQWSYEIAAGMEYLSSKKLIHRDLAARNILLTDQLVAKITDFGLSKNVYKNAKNYYIPSPDRTSQVPWKWFSIEAMSDMKFSVDSDIWAFGIVMYEIFTLGEEPYKEVPSHHIHLFLKEGRRLLKPEYANQPIYKIMQSCWNKEGSQRPRFSQLMEDIDNVRDTITQPDTFSTDSGSSYYEELGHFDSDNDIESQLSQSQEEENVV